MRLLVPLIHNRLSKSCVPYKCIFLAFMCIMHLAYAGSSGDIPNLKSSNVIPVLTPWLNSKGTLDPRGWNHAAHFSIPYEVSPGRNVPAPVSTQVDIGYTNKALLIRFIAHDPHPAQIGGRYGEHDNISSASDDFVGIFFSPFNDTQWAYEFFCTAGGVEWDAFRQHNTEYSSFDAIWSCNAKRTPTGYEVIMEIPFSSIKFPHSNKAQTWRLLLYRDWPRKLHYQLKDRKSNYDSDCRLCQMRIVHTETPIVATPANFQIIPAVTLTRTDMRNSPSGGVQGGSPKLDGSVDLRWVIQPNLEWAATLNPNFSQIAPDSLQLSVNKQFALFYPENRPFFEQGTQVFNTPGFMEGTDTRSASGQLVDTRQIVDPHWATKLVGQIGSNAIGVLAADDSATNILLPGQQESSIQSFNFSSQDALLRYRYDVGNSAYGFLATGRKGGGYSNGVYAFDTNWQIDPSDTVTALIGSSTTTYSTNVANALGIAPGTLTGQTWIAKYARDRRNYHLNVDVTHVSEDFRADMGYLPQVGYDEGAAWGEYEFYDSDERWWQNGGFGGFLNWTRATGGGPILDRRVRLSAFVHARYQSHFIVFATRDIQYFQGETFRLNQYELDASAQPTPWLNGQITTIGGDGIDYVGVRKGGLLSVSTSLSLSPGRHLRISLVNDFERLNIAGGRLYTADLYDVRIAWYFSSHLFMRAIAQEQNVRNNTALYPPGTPSRTRNLATQWMIGYQLNPWTAVYAGVANGYMDTGGTGLLLQQRQYFLKASYYFQP